jgi:hypothetical protein
MVMKERLLGAGEMNRRLEIFEKNYAKGSSGEPKLGDPQSLGHRYANRVDGNGTEEEDGQLVGVALAVFTMRYDSALASKATRLIIRDLDGDWEVSSPAEMLGSRARQMKLKCVRYGET